MRIFAFSSPTGVLVLFSLVASFSTTLWAQDLGSVLKHQKVSRSAGNGPNLRDSDQFGRGMDAIGDLDGDGVIDLIVGAPKDDDNDSDTSLDYGAAWILFMKSDGVVKSSRKISRSRGGWTGGLSAGDEFGRAVAGIGDFDGDGIPDVAVGSNYDDDGGSNSGAVYLFLMNRDGSVRTEQKLSRSAGNLTAGVGTGDQFGRGLCSLGDLDGDGVIDLAVGATQDDDGGLSNSGAIYVLFMNADLTVRADQKISQASGGFVGPLTSSSTLGFDLINLGDMDGDGVIEIASGAPDTKHVGPEVGALYVIFLNADGTVKRDVMITEGYGGFPGDLQDRDEFTACIGALGDLDGDGVGDIAVGSGKDDDGRLSGSSNHGAVWILYMNSDGTCRDASKISETSGGFGVTLQNGDRFGTSLAAPGDMDGDGVRDLVVGARFDDDGGQDSGAVYVLFLNDGTKIPAAAQFTASERFGAAPLAVDFVDESAGDLVQWSWDFGDGNTSSLASPMHTYQDDGAYTVTLEVTDSRGVTDTQTKAGYIVLSGAGTGVTRYGCGTNPVGSLVVISGGPILGTSMVFGVDNPYGIQSVGSVGVVLLALGPDPSYPCGTGLSGKGMDGGSGELLISLVPPNPARVLTGTPWGGVGNHSQIPFAVPSKSSLIGLKVYAQGYLLDPAGALRVGLADALELTLR